MNNKFKTYILALFAMLLWGSAFPVLKLTYEAFSIQGSDYANKMYIAGIRFFLAGLMVFIYVMIRNRKLLHQYKDNLKFILIVGILSTTINYLFFYIGVGNTSGVKSSILQSSSTFLTVIFAGFMLDEPLNSKAIIALIFGFLGVTIANITKGFDWGFSLQGEGFVLLTGITSAIGTIVVKKYCQNISALVLTSGQMLLGSVLLLVLGYFTSENQMTINTYGIGLLLYSALLSALAFTIWYRLLSENPASEISFLRLFIPIFGALLSFLVLGEPLSIYLLIGLIFVVLGVYLINKRKVH